MKKQIVFSGGLGNQMFQYVLFRNLKQHGMKCVINIDLFDKVKMHNGFELPRVFHISEGVVSNNGLIRFLIRFILKFRLRPFLFIEKLYVFNNNIYDSYAFLYSGNWINEEYLKPLENEIRSFFTFYDIDEKNKELSQRMEKEESVSIHIRRGDYLKYPTLCVCREDYFKRAITYMNTRLNHPKFYVFSDDIEWSTLFMTKLKVDYEIISHNQGIDSYKDMFLMASCRNNINSNSTFSWWGAWLNNNKNKIVISPKVWTTCTNENPACKEWVKM